MSGHQEDIELFHSMINRVLDREIAPFYEQWEEEAATPRELWHTLGQAGMYAGRLRPSAPIKAM
jgi:alkylation response protein AidB-like acyl-CoA dehydrogenase